MDESVALRYSSLSNELCTRICTESLLSTCYIEAVPTDNKSRNADTIEFQQPLGISYGLPYTTKTRDNCGQ